MTAVSEEGTTRALPIDKKMLSDMQKLVKTLEDDLRVRSDEVPEASAQLHAEYDEAVRAERTRAMYESWRDEVITQIAVAWVLACVFVRFMEDNDLVVEARLAGTGRRRQEVIDAHEAFFRENPRLTEREYLQSIFEDVARLPVCSDLFGKEHNPLWHLGLSGDGAKKLLEFWQQRDASGEGLLRTFERPAGDTRFLGDLYQDLSEAARKRYALLQTPDFVEEFILDYTLDPAIETFGLEGLRMIDPTCGSGHFLLGGFKRLCDRWRREEPGLNEREIARRALESVFGVDLNPFAVAIARFRLLVAALRFCGIRRMKDAPDFHVNLAAGDSLLHGKKFDRHGQGLFLGRSWLPDSVARGEYEAATLILSAQYHAVVGNPPYIVDNDKAHNEWVRERYRSCHRQFSLGVPFTERFFELANDGAEAGFVGMITTNSFMKRQFGKKLIEELIPGLDLTHVVDTSGAYIPGHGTPTVILFGRNRRPMEDIVRAVLGVRGEPETPADAEQGKVWRSVVEHLPDPTFQNEFISVVDSPREAFIRHPWSMGGGGASELKALVEGQASTTLGKACREIGFGAVTREDDCYLIGLEVGRRHGIPEEHLRPLVAGEDVRDWALVEPSVAIWPYIPNSLDATDSAHLQRFLWPWRAQLSSRVAYGLTQLGRGLKWYEYSMFFRERFRTPLTITFAEVSTHNHFALDRGGKVFNRTAPIIKLPPDKTEDDHLALLGLLNSSLACFWLKQVVYNKGTGTDKGNWQPDPAKFRYQFAVTGMALFPLPHLSPDARDLLIRLAREMSRLAAKRADLIDSALRTVEVGDMAARLQEVRQSEESLLAIQVALQEEIDWLVYSLYGLCEYAHPLNVEELLAHVGSPVGSRPFEVKQRGEGREVGVDGHRLYSELPPSASKAIREAWEARGAILASSPYLELIEHESYKRRWFVTPKDLAGRVETFEDRLLPRLKAWLQDRLESARYWPDEPEILSVARLASFATRDSEFLEVAGVYRDRADFDVSAIVAELVKAESVPALPALRYTESGLRKRTQWEATWSLQRREDAGEKVDKIPVPPKYTSADFQKSDYWRLRGKLDVPKERFISFPHCERDADNSLPILWTGYDNLQQAKAVAAYYLQCKEGDGWTADRLTPLLAALNEFVPWLLQWHNDVDPETGERLGEFYRGFLDRERRGVCLS